MRFLYVTGRDVEEIELALKMDAGIWTLLGEAEDYRTTKERVEIKVLLKEGPMTPKEVSEILKKSRGTVKKLLWSMSKDGEVVSRGHGKYGLP